MNTDSLLVDMVLRSWEMQNNQLQKLVDGLKAEQLSQEIAPGRNSGTYLLAHLIAVSDGMLPLLRFQDALFPEMEVSFVRQPDRSGQVFPDIDELKQRLSKVTGTLNRHFRQLTPAQWLERHTAVSEADFAKEPHRNRLNVVLNRTAHLAGHLGQLLLLIPRKEGV